MSSGITHGAGAIGVSLWKAVNPPPPPVMPLAGSLSTDVLIVGAGIAGLSLGVHLGAGRTDTVILESENDATAATGASAGIVAPQLVRSTPNSVLARLGPDAGARLLRMIADSGRYTFGLIDRLNIECGARRSGFLNPVSGQHGPRSRAQLIEEWRPFRDDLRCVDGAEVQALSGCRGYSAALVDPTGGCLDPLAYSRGLAQAARASGVPLHYGSRVLSVTRSGDRWLARTQSGEVSARRVVLCANGGNAALHPSLAQTLLPLPVCEVATQPLPASLRAKILPDGHALTDSSANVFSIRFDQAGRLITACPGRHRIDYAQINHLINARLAAMIPDYRSTPLEYIWQGTAWLNSSLLPRVLHVEDGLMAVQACNGRGIGLNTIIGRELGRWMADPNEEPPLVPIESPRKIAGFIFAKYLPQIMMGGAAIAKRTLGRFSRRT
ncbi:MAG: FAD-binding oxidoreductase [Steroidobacteraceae bacterium]|jgi:glycine/D-amino acid oxidase-like deaminating enzyme